LHWYLSGSGAAADAAEFARGELGEASTTETERLAVRRNPRDLSLAPALTAFAALVALFASLELGSLVVAPPALDA